MNIHNPNREEAQIMVNEIERIVNSIDRKITPLVDKKSTVEMLFVCFELFMIKSKMLADMIKEEHLSEEDGNRALSSEIKRAGNLLFMLNFKKMNFDSAEFIAYEAPKVKKIQDYLAKELMELNINMQKLIR